jgi:hypothetical protein
LGRGASEECKSNCREGFWLKPLFSYLLLPFLKRNGNKLPVSYQFIAVGFSQRVKESLKRLGFSQNNDNLICAPSEGTAGYNKYRPDH